MINTLHAARGVAQHTHTVIGRPLVCDYSGVFAAPGAVKRDECRVCACGAARFDSLLDDQLERRGEWSSPETDPELLRGLFEGALGAFANA